MPAIELLKAFSKVKLITEDRKLGLREMNIGPPVGQTLRLIHSCLNIFLNKNM